MDNSRKERFFSELLSLLTAGLDFSNSFSLIIEEEDDKKIAAQVKGVYQDIIAGRTLAESMETSGGFSRLDCGVIKVGEQTGRLSDSLRFLVEYYARRTAQRRLVSSAVSYPIIILCIALIVVTFMLAVIVPMFEQVYSRMDAMLPPITSWIISISNGFPTYATFFILTTAAIGFTLFAFRDRPVIRSVMAKAALMIPVAGEIIKKQTQCRLCTLLYLQTSSEVPLLQSVETIRGIITFYPYQRSLDEVREGLQKGELFSEALSRHVELYGKKFITLMRVAEETNRLPDMLKKYSVELTTELEYKFKQLGNILEPALITLVGVIVAVIMIAMYMPMFKLGGTFG